MYLSNSEAIEAMNEYGAKGIPFLFLIDFLSEKPIVIPANELNSEEILYQIGTYSSIQPSIGPLPGNIVFEKNPIPFEMYQPKFEQVMAHLKFGNSFLVNLSQPTPLYTNLEMKQIFYHSRANYKIYFKDEFVCFSPETFVRIEGGMISSYPMKGTINASIPNAQVLILEDEKEKAEHATITDLIRNDLSRIAHNVSVTRFRYIDTLQTLDKTLLQVSSSITGKLAENYTTQIGDILFSMLPAGSITGAPKPKTLEIILSVEGYDRNYYTGICGYFDGKNLDSGVMIRYIENQNGKLFFKSGGGITALSNAQSEYQEMIDKVYLPIYQNSNHP